MAGRLRVTLVKSPISHTSRTRGTVRALGLRRLGQTVEVADTPEMRGMTRAVRFLLLTEEIEGGDQAARPAGDDAPQGDDSQAAPQAGRGRQRSSKEESDT